MKNPSQDNTNLLENILQTTADKGNTEPLLEANLEMQNKILKELQNKKMEILGAEVIKIQGKQGEKGEVGDRGERGLQGIQGIQGKRGLKGEVGETGPTGPRGMKGENGRDGKDGSDGKDGKDAKPLTSQDIIAMISGKIKYGDIKDAPEFKPYPKWLGSGYFKDISDSQQWINKIEAAQTGVETPSGTMNGVNTTFIVTKTPKYLTFNGQCIYESAGYSLTGLTITLDLAPNAEDVLRSHY